MLKGWLSNYFNKESKYAITYVSFDSEKEIVYYGSSDIIFSIFAEIKTNQVETVGNLPFDVMYFDTIEEMELALETTKQDFEGCKFTNVNELSKIKAHYNLYKIEDQTIIIAYCNPVKVAKRNKSDFLQGIMQYFNNTQEMNDYFYRVADKVYFMDYIESINTNGKIIKRSFQNVAR